MEKVIETWLAPPQRQEYDPILAAAFARGDEAYSRTCRCGRKEGGGEWVIRATKARILKSSRVDSRDNTHIGWKRDLNLTLFAGQELPEVIYGDNSLEVCHAPTGLRISFTALAALRCWALLDHPPIPHWAELLQAQLESKNAAAAGGKSSRKKGQKTETQTVGTGAHQWDYTFTTSFEGCTDVIPAEGEDDEKDWGGKDTTTNHFGYGLPARPSSNGDSCYARPAVDLARGKSKLREALCNCTNGRTPLIRRPASVSAHLMSPHLSPSPQQSVAPRSSKASSASMVHEGKEKRALLPPPPPGWLPAPAEEQKNTDIAAMMREELPLPQPPTALEEPCSRPEKYPFFDTVDFWLDNLDPHSLSFLRASVVATSSFWAVQLRFFVRVNGVKARLIDTKFTCRFEASSESATVYREQSLREGSWNELIRGLNVASRNPAGTKAPRHVDFGGFGDRIAFRNLPLLRPPSYHMLVIAQKPASLLPEATSTVQSKLNSPWAVLRASPTKCVDLRGCYEWVGTIRDYGITGSGVSSIPSAIIVQHGGASVQAIRFTVADGDQGDDSLLWHRLAPEGVSFLSAALSPRFGNRERCRVSTAPEHAGTPTAPNQPHPQQCTGYYLLALGDDRGAVHIWDAMTGVPLSTYSLLPPAPPLPPPPTASGSTSNYRSHAVSKGWSTQYWVGHLCWSTPSNNPINDIHTGEDRAQLVLAAAAGRIATMTTVAVASLAQSGASTPRSTAVCSNDEGVDGILALSPSMVSTSLAARREHSLADGTGTVSAIGLMPSAALSSSLPLSPPSTDVAGRSLAIGGYGGIYWLHEQAETRVSEKGTSLPISEGMTKAEEVDCGMDFDEGSSNACDSHSSRTRPHEIGATATITLAVSPDERWLAIGCLDRRMRIFDLKHSTGTSEDAETMVEFTRRGNEEDAPLVKLHSLKNQPHLNGESGRVVKWLDSGRCAVKLDDGRGPFNIAPKNLKRNSTNRTLNSEEYGSGEFGHRGGLNKGSTNAVDWVGFDGPVKTILFSGTRRGGGEWLAAMGGSTLLVIPRRLRPGKAAIRCVVTCPHDSQATKFGALAWCPFPSARRLCLPSSLSDDTTSTEVIRQRDSSLLAAMDMSSGRTYVFDVASTNKAVPHCCAPFFVVDPPGDFAGRVIGASSASFTPPQHVLFVDAFREARPTPRGDESAAAADNSSAADSKLKRNGDDEERTPAMLISHGNSAAVYLI